jgi:hypothetical protein
MLLPAVDFYFLSTFPSLVFTKQVTLCSAGGFTKLKGLKLKTFILLPLTPNVTEL